MFPKKPPRSPKEAKAHGHHPFPQIIRLREGGGLSQFAQRLRTPRVQAIAPHLTSSLWAFHSPYCSKLSILDRCTPSHHCSAHPSPAPQAWLPKGPRTPSPQGARPGSLCPLLGGHEERGLRWRGPCALWRHEHVKLDEWRGDNAHLGAQWVEAEVDAAQGGHGGQLLHRHICEGERDRLGGLGPKRTMEQEDIDTRGEQLSITHHTWAQFLAPSPGHHNHAQESILKIELNTEFLHPNSSTPG